MEKKNENKISREESCDPEVINEDDLLFDDGNNLEAKFTEQQILVLDKNALKMSLTMLYFSVCMSSLSSTILTPNYPFLVTSGAHKDSFENTEPFDFSAATYFLPMTTLLGTAISAPLIGYLSDSQGRRPWILICLGLSTILNVVKYVVRRSFWVFSVVSFIQGFFSPVLPLGMAYVSDVKHVRSEKNAAIGYMFALNFLGSTGGGIIAVVIPTNLFLPLIVGAALTGIAFFLSAKFLIEPDRSLHLKTATDPAEKELQDLEDSLAPKSIDWRICINILIGELTDSFGSAGLFPICVAPLGFQIFYLNFVREGQMPIMTEDAFKWISVLVVVMIVPSAAASSTVFDKVGAAGGCILGNLFTAIVTLAVFFIATIDPPTYSTYGAFIATIYIGFPFTILSQLSTGPMLDMITPVDRRGFMQGLNITMMNFTAAVGPFILGTLADVVGTNKTIWICVGISLFAALINLPLMFVKVLKQPAIPDLEEDMALNDIENSDVFQAIMFSSFEDDEGNLDEIQHEAELDFYAYKVRISKYLNHLGSKEKRMQTVEHLTKTRAPVEKRKKINEDLGTWFKDYIVSAGYLIEESPVMYKKMIMKAFPPLREQGSELSEENVEQTLLNSIRFSRKYFGETGYVPHRLNDNVRASFRSLSMKKSMRIESMERLKSMKSEIAFRRASLSNKPAVRAFSQRVVLK